MNVNLFYLPLVRCSEENNQTTGFGLVESVIVVGIIIIILFWSGVLLVLLGFFTVVELTHRNERISDSLVSSLGKYSPIKSVWKCENTKESTLYFISLLLVSDISVIHFSYSK